MIDRLSGRRLLWGYLLLMALAGWQLLFDTRVQTDMSAFMPTGQNKAQQLLLQQLEHGPAARLWMLALSNASAGILADMSGELADKASSSAQVSQVMNGDMLLDDVTRERLFEYRYLLSDRISSASFSRAGLQQIFSELLQVLRSPLSTFSSQTAESDPSGELLHVLRSLDAGPHAPGLQHRVWFNEQGDKALLLLQSSASGTDLDAQQKLHQQLDLWLQQMIEDEPQRQSVSLEKGGVPLISLQTRERIRQASQYLSIAATVFMLLFMYLVYRRPLKVILTALPLFSGVVMGAAGVSWWFGSIHGITLAFGITLLGVAVDYPVHLLSHQRQGEKLQQTATRIRSTLALGVLSTGLGFSVMLWTEFSGLAQLGLFSVIGLLVAALVACYLLPVLAGDMPAFVRRSKKAADAPPSDQFGSGWAGYGFLHSPISGKLLLVLALLFGMAWTIQGKELWSRDIQALSPVPTDVRLADQAMRQTMGAPGPGHVMLLTADSVEQLLIKQEQIEPLLSAAIVRGYIRAADYVARIVPSKQQQQQRQGWIPVQQVLHNDLAAALENLPFKPASFTPFTEALQHSRQLPPLTPELLVDSPLGMRATNLLQSTETEVSGVIQLVGVQQPAALAELLQVASRNDLWLLDIPAATGKLVDRFREEMTTRAVLALLVIAALVALWLRDPVRWLKVMLPVVLSVAVSVTMVLATGAALNLFHLVSLLLVAGIGLDYALFFSRPPDKKADRQHTAQALMVCCFSTVVVFSLLAVSEIPVLHAIGLTVASGALAAFALSWVFSAQSG